MLRSSVLLLAIILCGGSSVSAQTPSAHPSPAQAQPTPIEIFKRDARPPADISKDKVAYVIGYAHLDTQWRWSYPQTIREYLANTLRQNFALFSKYPNYVFNFSGSRRYEMMKEYYPAEYLQMKKYVAAGRWFPCGSSVEEGDSVVPSLESMVRHVLYGNRYFRREFGVASDEFMLPDCFGFPASLPEILAHCGIKGFSTQKLTWGSVVGIPFNTGVWTGPDGSSVIAALNPGAYTSPVTADLSRNVGWLQRILETGSASGAFVDYHYFGTGDRGGAPPEGSVQWLERSLAGQGSVRIETGPADAMFKAITPAQREKLPDYTGDLLLTHHSAGMLSSQAYMKRWNRKSELLADAAERASTVAMWLGGARYPSAKLYNAWDLILGSQMHDMLPGTCLPKAYEYCWNDFVLAQNELSAVENDAVGSVVTALDTRVKGVALVVYNPLSIAREDLVDADVNFPSEAPEAVRVTGPDGKEVASQVEDRDGHSAHIVFAVHVPAFSFNTYDVQQTSAPGASSLAVSGSTRTLENGRYKVQLDENGDIASIFDKLYRKELLSSASRLAFESEKPADYPAWNMDWEDRQKPPRAYVQGPVKIRVAEDGPACVALETERDAEGSHFVQRIRLPLNGDAVEVTNKVGWRTAGSSLRASFPLTISNPQATYDDKVGVVARSNYGAKEYEVPIHQWMDLSGTDGGYGVSILSDCKYGADKPADDSMRLTLLYTPEARSFQDQSSQDFGRHDFAYAIAGHAGDWKKTPWQGSRFNQPLVAFQAPAHPGSLGRQFSFLGLSSNHVEIAAVKKAEDGDEIIVRLRELSGAEEHGVNLTAPRGIASAREVDGQERPVKSNAKYAVSGGGLSFDLPAFGLRAFALKLIPSGQAAQAVRTHPVDLPYNLDAVSAVSNPADGAFDSDGRTYPAEQLPMEIVSEGVTFTMGPTKDGAKNAVACNGQIIPLPDGDFNRLYILASAVNGDASGAFAIGDRRNDLTVQNWNGYIGQWDRRLWKGVVPDLTYNWTNALDGLVPGYVKRDTVAWYASHENNPKTGVEYYQYCYLFKYGFQISPGARTITLPVNDRIRVFAITAALDHHDDAVASQALYDTLSDHQLDGPGFSPSSGKFSDFTPVTIVPPLYYWQEGGIHYTLDGSEPVAASPIYSGPLQLDADATVKARMIFPDGKTGPVATARYEITDTTPPAVREAEADYLGASLTVRFSEPVSAVSGDNFQLEPATPVSGARLSDDGTSAVLSLGAPVTEQSKLTVTGIADKSTRANRLSSQTLGVTLLRPVWSMGSALLDGTTAMEYKATNLPTKGNAPWTLNLFVRTDTTPENHTLIAGFGDVRDAHGIGRYVCQFANGIHFWNAGNDCDTTTALDLKKWQMLTVTYDGHHLSVYKNAAKIGEAEEAFEDDASIVHLSPLDPWEHQHHFKGEIRDCTIWASALSPETLKEFAARMPR